MRARSIPGQMSVFDFFEEKPAVDGSPKRSKRRRKQEKKEAERQQEVRPHSPAVEAFVRCYDGTSIGQWRGIRRALYFGTFCRELAESLRDDAKALGFEMVSLKPGYYDMDGYLKKDGRYAYWSFSVRPGTPVIYLLDLPGQTVHRVLYRTARDEGDHFGGRNHFTTLADLLPAVSELLEKKEEKSV